MEDENIMEFHTNLPIQLDATCNGFQHMALLSNETELFKELNLVDNCSGSQSDFYSFLFHRLTSILGDKLAEGVLEDDKTQGSYERLNKFM